MPQEKLSPTPEFHCDYFITNQDGSIQEADDIYDAIHNACEDFYALCMVGTKKDTFPLVWYVERNIIGLLKCICPITTDNMETLISEFQKNDFCFWMILPATEKAYRFICHNPKYIKGYVEHHRVDIKT